jgi:hypothetical protein
MKFVSSIIVLSIATVATDPLARLKYLKQTMQKLVPSGVDSAPAEEPRTALVELARKFAANEGRETDLFVDSFKIVKSNGIGPDGYESVIWEALDAVFSASKKRGAEELQSDSSVANKKQLVEQVQFSPKSDESVVEQKRGSLVVDEPRVPIVATGAIRRLSVSKEDIMRKLEPLCSRQLSGIRVELSTKYLARVAAEWAKEEDWESLGLMVDVFMKIRERLSYQLFRDAWNVMSNSPTCFLSRLWETQIAALDGEMEQCMDKVKTDSGRVNPPLDPRDRDLSDRLVEFARNGQTELVVKLYCLASIASIARSTTDSLFYASLSSIRK